MKLYPHPNRDNTALIVIDPINSCAHEKCEHPQRNIRFSKIRSMLSRLNSFIDKYREEIGGLVVVTTTVPWKKEFLPDNLNELYSDPNANYYSQDHSGFDEQFYGIYPLKDDLIITKNTYDAFADDKLLEELHKRNIQYIVVTGVFSDGCVLASIVGGFSRGYNFVILKDLIETTDSETRQEIQRGLVEFTFPKMFGLTINSNEFLENYSKRTS